MGGMHKQLQIMQASILLPHALEAPQMNHEYLLLLKITDWFKIS